MQTASWLDSEGQLWRLEDMARDHLLNVLNYIHDNPQLYVQGYMAHCAEHAEAWRKALRMDRLPYPHCEHCPVRFPYVFEAAGNCVPWLDSTPLLQRMYELLGE